MHYVYILANQTNVAIYIGVTNDLVKRVWQHKEKIDRSSFTARYNINKLVYFEVFSDPYSAISREKQLKSWKRAKKNELVESTNPEWLDLYNSVLG